MYPQSLRSPEEFIVMSLSYTVYVCPNWFVELVWLPSRSVATMFVYSSLEEDGMGEWSIIILRYRAIQWNLSIKDTLNGGDLSYKGTVCSTGHIELRKIYL